MWTSPPIAQENPRFPRDSEAEAAWKEQTLARLKCGGGGGGEILELGVSKSFNGTETISVDDKPPRLVM